MRDSRKGLSSLVSEILLDSEWSFRQSSVYLFPESNSQICQYQSCIYVSPSEEACCPMILKHQLDQVNSDDDIAYHA